MTKKHVSTLEGRAFLSFALLVDKLIEDSTQKADFEKSVEIRQELERLVSANQEAIGRLLNAYGNNSQNKKEIKYY